ncbi:UNVERIFIED_CONTAM: hypothetical protein FKN15_022104 [Acipenser sinensis]
MRDLYDYFFEDYVARVVPEYTFTDFKSHFRLTQGQVEDLIRDLHPFYINHQGTKWPFQNTVLACLWTLVNQESYRGVADRFNTSKSNICIHLHEGWYIVTYALGIYHLNLLVAFLSPKIEPSLLEDSDDDMALPTHHNEEFRPFIRRLPEFKFWYSATKAVLVAMVMTFFEMFNIPVFWPILVLYFIMLTCMTMKRQIRHMIKYRYVPFSHGKTRYRGKEDTGDVFIS